jgi:hypothetical protein
MAGEEWSWDAYNVGVYPMARLSAPYEMIWDGNYLNTADGGSVFTALYPNIKYRLPLATNAAFTLLNVTATNSGYYSVAIRNTNGILQSALASLQVLEPGITAQPTNVSVFIGGSALLQIAAAGAGPLFFQWRKDGVNIPGATTASLRFSNIQPGNIGSYSVIVSNAAGTLASSNAMLTIPGIPTEIWQGLVAYYPFTGNANDESGLGNHGAVNGALLTADRFGSANRAYHFDGENNFIQLPDAGAFKSEDFTVSVWFKPERYPIAGDHAKEANFLISKGQNNFEICTGSGLSGPSGMQFLPRLTFGNNWDTPPASYETNVWQHAIAIYQPSINNIHFFLNGQETPLTGPANKPSLPDNVLLARLGMRSDGTLAFKGSLDNVRIYRRALSEKEVQLLYATENTSPFPHRALASATVINGSITGAVLTDFGFGYTDSPVVRVVGGAGAGARFTASLANGSITDLILVDGGSGYSGTPRLLIESPPGEPWVEIKVSRVNVVQHVRVNHSYVLESSANLTGWSPVDVPFVADTESITNELQAGIRGAFYRLREVGAPVGN